MKKTAELNIRSFTTHEMYVVLHSIPEVKPEDKVQVVVVIYPSTDYGINPVSQKVVKTITLSHKDMMRLTGEDTQLIEVSPR